MFSPVKIPVKCTQTYHFGDKNDLIFVWGGGPAPPADPTPSEPTEPRPLTEILNTPLIVTMLVGCCQQENGYLCRHEAFTFDRQWLWNNFICIRQVTALFTDIAVLVTSCYVETMFARRLCFCFSCGQKTEIRTSSDKALGTCQTGGKELTQF